MQTDESNWIRELPERANRIRQALDQESGMSADDRELEDILMPNLSWNLLRVLLP